VRQRIGAFDKRRHILDGRRITLTLRKGIKWSDGVPLTSDDFLFVFNDVWLNKEYAPVTNRIIEGGRAVKVTDRIFYYEFEEPRPLMVNYLAQ
jgi:peptide/nickel transport system substrate-binding protein|tara:strand:- start:595 stop:873 length:279 start_codon:yes stop_codon:yes gene_type:complete